MRNERAVHVLLAEETMPAPGGGHPGYDALSISAPATPSGAKRRGRGRTGHAALLGVASPTPCASDGAASGLDHDVRQNQIARGESQNDAAVSCLQPNRTVPRRRRGRPKGVPQNTPAPAQEHESSGHNERVTRSPRAAAGLGQPENGIRARFAEPALHDAAQAAGEGQLPRVAQVTLALAPIIAELREQHRQRQDLHRAEKSLTLQIKAKCRRLCDGELKEAGTLYSAMMGKGSHALADVAQSASLPFLQARALIAASRAQVEKRLLTLAKQLPVVEWVQSVRGFGLGNLAAIIGETGDLSLYSNPAKVWKRMGLAVMPDGQRQRRVSGADALDHGYSPSRRSIAWNLGECIVKLGGAGPYRALYDARKAYETERDPAITKAKAHNRAKRYMEKRLLKHLWRAWRAAVAIVSTTGAMPPADHTETA